MPVEPLASSTPDPDQPVTEPWPEPTPEPKPAPERHPDGEPRPEEPEQAIPVAVSSAGHDRWQP